MKEFFEDKSCLSALLISIGLLYGVIAITMHTSFFQYYLLFGMFGTVFAGLFIYSKLT